MTFYIKRIWNMDKQFPELCLTFGGITTGIQILHHVIMFRITNGLPLGTSNTDTWRLKPSTRCQLLVDRSELCTNAIFKFSQLILKASARKKEKRTKSDVACARAQQKVPLRAVDGGCCCRLDTASRRLSRAGGGWYFFHGSDGPCATVLIISRSVKWKVRP